MKINITFLVSFLQMGGIAFLKMLSQVHVLW